VGLLAFGDSRPSRYRACEGIAFCVWRGARVPVARPCGEGGSGGEREKGDDPVSASRGFDLQAAGGHQVVRERMPERMSLRLDEPASGEKTKAMVLAIGVDELDALAQGVDGVARFARHALPPFLEAKGFFRPLADPPRQRARLDGLLFVRRRLTGPAI
jgi:hypothetical protein